MTTGQLLFYSGAGLFILTILLAIVFVVKRPVYTPENAVNLEGKTESPRNGYLTEQLTKAESGSVQDRKRETVSSHNEIIGETTECLKETEGLTEVQSEEGTALLQETELLI